MKYGCPTGYRSTLRSRCPRSRWLGCGYLAGVDLRDASGTTVAAAAAAAGRVVNRCVGMAEPGQSGGRDLIEEWVQGTSVAKCTVPVFSGVKR